MVEGFDLHLFQDLLLHDFFVFLLHITFFLLQVFMRIPGCHPRQRPMHAHPLSFNIRDAVIRVADGNT